MSTVCGNITTRRRRPMTHTPEYDPTQVGYPLQRVHRDVLVAARNRSDDLPTMEWWPIPWINGEHGAKGDFYSFRDDMRRAETERLCCVCGNGLHQTIAIAANGGLKETSGGWGHPKCVKLTISICPHFTRQNLTTVAYAYQGAGVGLEGEAEFSIDHIHPDATPLTAEQLTELAAADPWGKQQLVT
jgi:hypothetical protein